MSRGVPLLNKLPYLNRLFRNQGIGREVGSSQYTIIPRIINLEEEEFRQTGVSPETLSYLESRSPIVGGAPEIGVDVRAAVHVAEVQERDGDVFGLGVTVTSRLLDLAGPAEVVSSRAVADVVAGDSFRFDGRGRHRLKGLPGEWEVCRLRR